LVAQRQHHNDEGCHRSHAAGDNEFSGSFAVHTKTPYLHLMFDAALADSGGT
jgi:hypothetical protein